MLSEEETEAALSWRDPLLQPLPFLQTGVVLLQVHQPVLRLPAPPEPELLCVWA